MIAERASHAHAHRQHWALPAPGLALLGALLLVFAGYPLVRGIELIEPASLLRLFTPQFAEALGNSVLLTVLVVVPATLIAVPLAWLCARTNLPGRDAMILMTSISFVVPVLLIAIAYTFLLGRNAGLVNRLFSEMFGRRLFDVYSFAGIVIVCVLHCFPLIFMTTLSGLTKMSAELEEAGRSCGLSPAGVFFRITLGVILPSIMAGVAFAAAETITMLAAPLVLGLPIQLHFVTTELYAKIVLDPNLSESIVFGLPLIALTLLLLWAQQRLLGDAGTARFAIVSGKGARGDRTSLGRYAIPVSIVAWIPLVFSLLIPLGTLTAAAFMTRWFRGFTADNFTLRNIVFVFTDDQTLMALRNSLVLAFGLGVAMALLGALTAILIAGPPTVWKRMVRVLVNLPLGLPHVVAGILVILAWYGPPLRLGGSLWILVFGYVLIMLPFAVKICDVARGQIDNALIEAAEVAGCSPRQSWRFVLMPLMKSGVATTCVMVFLFVVKEFSLTAMVYSSQTQTLAVRIYASLESGGYEKTAATAILLVAVTLACMLVAKLLLRVTPVSLP